jgi:membrane protease YdiL (CAAX protease family)
MQGRWKKSLWFLLGAFALSWSIAAVLWITGTPVKSLTGTLLLTLYMFMPMVAAILVQKVACRQPLREPLRISFRLNRWFAVAWLLPPLLVAASLGLSLLLPEVSFAPRMEGMIGRFASQLTPEQRAQLEAQLAAISPLQYAAIGLAQGLLAGVTVNALAGFGEESGWRGLLQRELRFLGFWRSSGLIGVVWGLWHAPVILMGHNYPQHPVLGVFMMTAFTVLFGLLISFVTLKANSVIAAAVMHGTLNAVAGFGILFVKGGDDLTTGLTGLPGLVVLLVADLILFALVGKEPFAGEEQGASAPAERA